MLNEDDDRGLAGGDRRSVVSGLTPASLAVALRRQGREGETRVHGREKKRVHPVLPHFIPSAIEPRASDATLPPTRQVHARGVPGHHVFVLARWRHSGSGIDGNPRNAQRSDLCSDCLYLVAFHIL